MRVSHLAMVLVLFASVAGCSKGPQGEQGAPGPQGPERRFRPCRSSWSRRTSRSTG
jgi:hypothetical protein